MAAVNAAARVAQKCETGQAFFVLGVGGFLGFWRRRVLGLGGSGYLNR